MDVSRKRIPDMGMDPNEVNLAPKAHAIEKRHKHQCDICMAIDTDEPTLKFHVYEEALSEEYENKEICDECLKDLKAIRKKCNGKVDNPKHDSFADFMPHFTKDMPGLREAFKKILS